jgi:ribonuclease VapC
MVIDTSAIFAAIAGKPDSGVYRNAIISAPLRLISAVTLLETQIVLVSRSGSNSIPILHELIERAGVVVVPFDEPMAETAFDAFKRYGKGQGHKAQLNIIDCAA